jgi:pimeloyl-ACP methyl ester carboxylesterase
MPWATADDGADIYYETTGSGPAVAFVSGYMGITDIWRHQVQALAATHTCVAFDLRGAGRSDKPLPQVAYGVERHAADLGAVLADAGVARAALVGHSMGGAIVTTFALANPEQVDAVGYVGSYSGASELRQVGHAVDVLINAVRTLPGRVGFYESVGLPADIAMEATKWPLYALEGQAWSAFEFEAVDRIAEITVPALVVHGDADMVTPLDPCGTGLAERLPDSRLHVLAGVRHCPMTEAAEETSELLRAFLAEVGAAA